jgi:RHS repeat-associated protein
MQARYQNSSRGQFISEDPIFLGNPSQQNLTDPQSLNSYSYADDNPVVKKDPNGQCPTCLVVGGAVVLGAVGGVAQQGLSDVVSDYGTYGLNVQDYQFSPAKDYAHSAFSGAALGLAISTGGAFGLGAVSLGVIAGGGTAVSDAVKDQYVDQVPLDPSSIGFDSVTAGLTAGLIEATPKIPGAKPKTLVTSLLTGSHATNNLLRTTVGTVSGGFSSGLYSSYTNFSRSSGNGLGTSNSASGGGNSPSLTGLYQSLIGVLTSLVSALSAGKH